MRILIISYDFYPNIGGVAAHAFNLSRFLAKLGHEVFVFTLRYKRSDPSREQVQGVRIYRFLVPNAGKLRGIFFMLQVAPFAFFFSLGRKLDVVHSHNILPDAFASRFCLTRKKIFTNHTSQFLELFTFSRRRLARFLARWVIAGMDYVISPSRELHYKSELFFEKNQGYFYIPNGVDIKDFFPAAPAIKAKQRAALLAEYGIAQTDFVILCPRRLEPKNGIEFFIQAFALLARNNKGVAFIVGNDFDKKYAASLRQLAQKLKLTRNLIFTGPVPNTRMLQYYQAADVAVLPSLMEATSISGLEAMACGLPLVATNVGGIPEIVFQNQTGVLVTPRNPQALADGILRILQNKGLARQFGLEARRRMEKYLSWEKVTKKTLKIYSLAGN